MSYFYVYLDPQNLIDENLKLKIEFNDSNLSSITVNQLKNKLSSNSKIKLPLNYDLVFFGRPLKPDTQLSNYGIKTGANLFVIEDNKKNEIAEKNESSKEKSPELEQIRIKMMVLAIRTALLNANFRTMLNRLYDKDFRENVAACTPSLRDNIIAFSILQDPELMMICHDTENLIKMTEDYFVFVEAASQLAAAFHEEVAQTSNNSSSNIFGQENAYSLQNYDSDEDNLEITAEMIYQAIQNARSSFARPQNPVSVSNSSNNNLSSSNSILSSTSANNNQNPSDWTQQLNQMREMGFNNDAVSIQALEASNGNFEQAVNLYFDLNNQGNE